jgi:hypothetical protein
MEKSSVSFKIVVLGEGKSSFQKKEQLFPFFLLKPYPELNIARVGKTSLTLRFCKGSFDDRQISTIDASCLNQTIGLGNGQKVQLSIWDTAGQERYHALNKVYYQGAHGKWNQKIFE